MPARAELLLDQRSDYYDVTGATAQEVRANLDRIGPTWPLDGKRYDSAVSWAFKWEGRFGPTARGCLMKAVTVRVRTITTSPRLKVDAATPPALQKAFAAFTQKLAEYDKHRATIAIEVARRIEDGIIGLPPQPDCLDFQPIASQLVENLEKETARVMHDYIRRTDAGRALGAVFPPRDQPPAQAAAPRAKSAAAGTPDAAPKSPKEAARGGSGSGFFIARHGTVVTNAHVVEGCAKLSVRTVQGAVAPATVLAQSEHDDLAVLKSDAQAAQVAPLRTTAPRAGEAVVAYGFPLSGLLSSTGNATTGSISALAGLRNDSRHLQISAPVQPGNSGGPLIDMSGNVVGVVFSKLNALRVARATKDIPQNINFAIKASVATNFLDAGGISYFAAQGGKELAVPDVVERAMAFSVQVQCAK
jgi:S1-C subfamily serine protease